MSRFLFSALLLLVAIASEAQNTSFLNGLRSSEAGKGRVTVTQSTAIEALVNGTAPASTTPPPAQQSHPSATASQTPAKETHQSAGATNHDNKKAESERPSAAHTPSTSGDVSSSTDIDTRKKIMRNSYKTKGYRIQVYSGGNSRADRQKAESAGSAMKRMFPSEPIYVHFYSPSWKCRMGNYTDLNEAKRVLRQVKTAYPQACIVKGTISVQY